MYLYFFHRHFWRSTSTKVAEKKAFEKLQSTLINRQKVQIKKKKHTHIIVFVYEYGRLNQNIDWLLDFFMRFTFLISWKMPNKIPENDYTCLAFVARKLKTSRYFANIMLLMDFVCSFLTVEYNYVSQISFFHTVQLNLCTLISIKCLTLEQISSRI